MMKCSYHPVNRALVQCQACGRPLCPLCDHRIKGFAYCQDCIVRGVEMLQSAGASSSASPRRLKRSSVMAVMASLIPGLGAVYNGQNAKAFLHFIVICGLFQLAETTGLDLFAMGGGVFYLYSMIDAVRTARAIRRGMDPAREDERLRRFMRENLSTWGGILIGLGLLFLLTDVFQVNPPSLLLRLWPLLLVGLGVYLMLRQWWGDPTDQVPEPPSATFRVITPSLFPPSSRQAAGPADSRDDSSIQREGSGRPGGG